MSVSFQMNRGKKLSKFIEDVQKNYVRHELLELNGGGLDRSVHVGFEQLIHSFGHCPFHSSQTYYHTIGKLVYRIIFISVHFKFL